MTNTVQDADALIAELEKDVISPEENSENRFWNNGISHAQNIIRRHAQPQAQGDDKRILEVIDERDLAEHAMSQAYYLITGKSPEWSNHFRERGLPWFLVVSTKP